MKEIELTQGKVAIVDDGDYEELSKYKWYAHLNPDGKFYAMRMKPEIKGGKRGVINMHRVIINCPDGMCVDHVNRNTLDNRRENLRLCNKSQNATNSMRLSKGSVCYRGVYYHRLRKKYAAAIRIKGKNTHLGLFKSPIAAALVYDTYAVIEFGDFARLNFPAYT